MKNLFKDCKTVSDCEEKLNKLIESWPVVYNEERATAWTCISSPLDIHQARLAFIEPIVKEYTYIDSGVDFNGERLYRKVEK